MNDQHKTEALLDFFKQLSKVYEYGPVWYCSLTANVILKHRTEHTYSVWFGQQPHSGLVAEQDGGVLNEEYVVRTPQDIHQLPTSLNIDDFAAANLEAFSHSGVIIQSIISLIYIFSRELTRYNSPSNSDRRTPGRQFVQLL